MYLELIQSNLTTRLYIITFLTEQVKRHHSLSKICGEIEKHCGHKFEVLTIYDLPRVRVEVGSDVENSCFSIIVSGLLPSAIHTTQVVPPPSTAAILAISFDLRQRIFRVRPLLVFKIGRL